MPRTELERIEGLNGRSENAGRADGFKVKKTV
jgi:hypothetical protein